MMMEPITHNDMNNQIEANYCPRLCSISKRCRQMSEKSNLLCLFCRSVVNNRVKQSPSDEKRAKIL
jgi:hypothetical protein